MIRTVNVGRPPHAFDVLIGSRLLDRAGDRLAPLAPGGRAAVITDRNVADHHGERLAAALEAAPLAVELLIHTREAPAPRAAAALGLTAGDLVLLFGGATIAALARELEPVFAAGAGLVAAPTSLYAQVECAGAAGSTPPRLVLADLDVLATLAPTEALAGYAEILKYALAADARFFRWLEAHGRCILQLKAPELAHAVGRCTELRAEVVDAEPGRRTALALGHDFARALAAEAAEPIRHADAVAVGCALAFQFSEAIGACNADDAESATWNFAAADLPVRLEELPGTFHADRLVRRLSDAGGGLDLVLARAVGDAFLAEDLDPAALKDFLIAEGASR